MKSPVTSSPPRPRATLAQVAKLAAVSLMTASYAMRNNPKISLPTREKVQRAALKVGYVPHPEIGRLMHLLRSNRVPSYQATLAFLSFFHTPQTATHHHTTEVVAGAKKRAIELGYSVDVLSIEHSKLGRARLTTMLKSRGIRGVLVPPLPEIEDCSQMLDWSQFSIIAATYSAQNLVVNRVMPHHQHNIMQVLAQLRGLGYRRLGLVLTGDLVHRVNSAYHAALALHQLAGDFALLPPLSLASADVATASPQIRPWLKKERPDVLITVEAAVPALLEALGRSRPTPVRICLLDHSGIRRHAGIHQHPSVIGETAVELLAGQIQRGEFGFRQHPRVTMIEGTWVPFS